MLGEHLGLFATAEIFIFVFMEIVTKIGTIQRVLFKKAHFLDNVIFVILFGLFSIFGTYVGIPNEHGAISNIRDLAPLVAGLVAGPYIGVAVGLIGGIHRLSLGGASCFACSLATVLIGLLAGMVNRLNKGKLLDIIPAMLFGGAVEVLHGVLVLALVQPFPVGVGIFSETIPGMIIANSLGVGISVIVINNAKEQASVVNHQ